MKKLKTDYKNDKFPGKRIYQITNVATDKIALDDVTEYTENGDIFNADDVNGANKVINELSTMVTSMNGMLVITMRVSNWSASAPYMQIIAVSGMTKDSTPIPGMLYPDNMTEIIQAQIDKSSGMITDMESMDGKIKVICRYKKPSTDLIICLKGVL